MLGIRIQQFRHRADEAGLDTRTCQEERARCTMVGAGSAIFLYGPAKFA